MNKRVMTSQLYNLITNNNKIIDAIENNKNINMEKSIKACMRSSNIVANILITYFEENTIKKPKMTPSDDSTVNNLRDMFGMFDQK